MSREWSRWRAIAGLLLAILNDVRRRAWWAYRRGSLAPVEPRIALIARRETQARPYAPRLTPAWQALAERALRIEAAGIAIVRQRAVVPVVWIDAAERPEIRDLPRVLRQERAAGEPVVATQWLHDSGTRTVLLVITFVDPATSSWALRFDPATHAALLERIIRSGRLIVLCESPLDPNEHGEIVAAWHDEPPRAIPLPIASAGQLVAILEDIDAARLRR
jgi:hypothetical protein